LNSILVVVLTFLQLRLSTGGRLIKRSPMALRASWTGYLRLSLITIPVRLFNAINSADKISLNQLHKACNSRLRQKLVCPTHGEVEREQVAKGYEYEDDRYVVIEDSDLKAVRLETTKIIELVSFADASQLDPIFLDSPYYVSPDGAIAEEGFRVLREAMRELDRVAIGRVVLTGREHLVAMGVQEKGLRMSTLRYASEIKAAAPYFEDIKNGNVNSAQLGLAKQLVEQFTTDFKPEEFTDRYRDALMDVIKTKIAGAPVVAQQVKVGKVVNLMEALKQSLEKSQATMVKKPPIESVTTAARAQKKTRRA
jgi:DNA end-binding protein Ku